MPPPPRKGESAKEWVPKCIAVVTEEDPDKSSSQVAGECYGMYRYYTKKRMERD